MVYKTTQFKRQLQNRPIKIMVYSNAESIATGYACVVRSIFFRLAKDKRFEICLVGENYTGSPYKKEGCQVVGVESFQNPDKRMESLADHMNYWKPDILWVLEDTFTMTNQGFYKLNIPKNVIKVGYVPVDGGTVPTTGDIFLRCLDKIVSMSTFTQDELKKENYDSELILHGVDTELFKPIDKETMNTFRIFYGFDEDDFIVFSMARNSIRKRNQLMIESFTKFAKDKPKAKLFLHIFQYKVADSNLEHYIKLMEKKYGYPVSKQIKFTKNCESYSKPATDEEIARYFQIADVIFSMSSGEGSGLIMPQGMACEKPVVHTNYTTTEEWLLSQKEKYGKRGEPVKVQAIDTTSYNTQHAIGDLKDAVKKLTKLYNNEKLREVYGKNGRNYVVNEVTWGRLTEQWKDLFLRLMGYDK